MARFVLLMSAEVQGIGRIGGFGLPTPTLPLTRPRSGPKTERNIVSMHFEETETAGPTANGKTSSFVASEEFARFLRHTEGLATEGRNPESLRAWLDLAEAWRITQALRECKGNRSAAARLLGIGRRTLYAKMDKLGITPSWQV